MSVLGITVTFQSTVLILLALIFMALVVIIVMLRRQKSASSERHDDLLVWHDHTAELVKKLNPQVNLETAVKEILAVVDARASIATTQFEQQQQAVLTAFTQAAGRELEEFRSHAQRVIGQAPPRYTFPQQPQSLPAAAPLQPRVLPSPAPQQALVPVAPVWQAPNQGPAGQVTGYFPVNGRMGMGGTPIGQSEAETDPGYSTGYDDVAPQVAEPEVGQVFEPEADFEPEHATTPEPEPVHEPEPEPVSEVAEPEHMLHTGDDMATDPPQADMAPDLAQPAEPAKWNAADTLRGLPIAALVLNEVNSRFPKTETDLEPVDPTQPEAPAPTDLTVADQPGTNDSSE